MIGQSKAFRAVQVLIDEIAVSDVPVLVDDETDTRQERADCAIQFKGTWGHYPFVPTNSGAHPEQLIKNEEPRGHRPRALADAWRYPPGFIGWARSVTLLLDTVGTPARKRQFFISLVRQGRQFQLFSGSSLERHESRR